MKVFRIGITLIIGESIKSSRTIRFSWVEIYQIQNSFGQLVARSYELITCANIIGYLWLIFEFFIYQLLLHGSIIWSSFVPGTNTLRPSFRDAKQPCTPSGGFCSVNLVL